LNFESETGAKLHEKLNLKYWFAEVNPIDTAILKHLKRESFHAILGYCGAVTDYQLKRVMLGLQALNEANAIILEIGEVLDSSQRIVKITKEGERLLNEIPPVEEEFVIRYTYEKRPEATGGSIIPTTREFCRDLVKLVEEENTSWQLDEIQDIGVSNNRNVWMRGGGFWGKILPLPTLLGAETNAYKEVRWLTYYSYLKRS
jgi:hypothetical protein